jgi:hypothetical protein
MPPFVNMDDLEDPILFYRPALPMWSYTRAMFPRFVPPRESAQDPW